MTGFGSVQATGILVAQLATAPQTASYLLALRLIQTVSQFSQAPFYTKIPTLAKLRAQGEISLLLHTARTGMRYSYLTFLAGFFTLAIFAEPILMYINSNVDYVGRLFWTVLGIAIFAERYGAMHIQLYSITNKIIWHIANGVTGVLLILFSILLYGKLGLYAFPISILLSNLFFYSWYSASHSYKEYNLKFLDFEMRAMLPPAISLTFYLCIVSYLYF